MSGDEQFDEQRRTLVEALPKAGVGAEIGVWKGEFSGMLLALTQPRELHLIDPWMFAREFPRRWYGGGIAKSQSDMDSIFTAVRNRFERSPNVRIHRCPSAAAAIRFPNLFFDWVYIDGDHSFDAKLLDLRLWRPKVKSGGILAGDDWGWRDEQGNFSVQRAVICYAEKEKHAFNLLCNDQFVFQL